MGGGAGGSKVAGAGIIGDERGAMQNLNDRLANYIETVRNLELANKELEQKIMVAMKKGGPQTRDYTKYESIIEDLRRKVNLNMNEWIMYSCGFTLDCTKASVHIQMSSILPYYNIKIDSQICFSDSSSFTSQSYYISFKRLKGVVVGLSSPPP